MAGAPTPPRSATERISVIVALITSITAAAVGVFNGVFYFADRNERLNQDKFNDQVSIARTYFDTFSKVPVGQFCNYRSDALLFGRTSLKIAGLDESATALEIATKTQAGARPEQNEKDVKGVAILIYSNILDRDKSECAGAAQIVVNVKPGQVAAAPPTAADPNSSYALQQQSTPPPASTPSQFTIWIQYSKEGPADKARASTIQEQLQAAAGQYKVPGIQGVAAVPGQDQLRIFHARDAQAAKAVAAKIGLPNVQIVSLESAYPNLPNGVMELWLKQSSAAP